MTSPQTAGKANPGSIAWDVGRRLLMVIALTLAFLLSATATIYLLFRSGDTRVPDVVGKSEIEAQQMAQQSGLRVKIVRREDAKVPANTVIETRPGPNSSVKKDSGITIIVSSGPPQTKSALRAPSRLRHPLRMVSAKHRKAAYG